MKCIKCGSFDSYSECWYKDKNGHLFSRSELEAFKTLHPEVKNVFFEKVLICGFCLFSINEMR